MEVTNANTIFFVEEDMSKDMTVQIDDGYINIRVGAIIMKDGRFLMVGNEKADYLYSVGGRIKFGETAEAAIIREVYEETGVKMEIDRLGFIHENYFIADSPEKLGKLIYEISFFFYMKAPKDFEPVCNSFTEDNCLEYLTWVSPNTNKTIYPTFFKTELSTSTVEVKHIVTDQRLSSTDR